MRSCEWRFHGVGAAAVAGVVARVVSEEVAGLAVGTSALGAALPPVTEAVLTQITEAAIIQAGVAQVGAEVVTEKTICSIAAAGMLREMDIHRMSTVVVAGTLAPTTTPGRIRAQRGIEAALPPAVAVIVIYVNAHKRTTLRLANLNCGPNSYPPRRLHFCPIYTATCI